MLGSAQVDSRFRSARLGWLGTALFGARLSCSSWARLGTLFWARFCCFWYVNKGRQWAQIVQHQISSEPLKPLLPALGLGLGSLAWPEAISTVLPEARLASAPDRCSAWLRARFSAQDTRTRLDFARGSSRFAQGPAQLESLLITGRGSGSVRLGSIR